MFLSKRAHRAASIVLVIIVTLGLIALSLGQAPAPAPQGPTSLLASLFA